MKQHLRTDAFKVFEDDDKAMRAIKLAYGLPDKNWKSTALRIALDQYLKSQALTTVVSELSQKVETTNVKLEELYFIVQGVQS